MELDVFLIPPAESARRKGPHDRIVMSSRVRLARNLKEAAFPGWAKKVERVRVLELLRPAIETLPEMKGAFSGTMDSLSSLDKQILVERHLISREHAAKSAGSGLVLNREETLCVMINEEDHLRMQALRPGLQLRQAWAAIDQADFKKAGRLGCPECYETFAEPLGGLLKTMHKGTRHVGKVPESLRQTLDFSDRLKGLQKKLAKAIEEEDFEKAAVLRDEIKQITARAASATAS